MPVTCSTLPPVAWQVPARFDPLSEQLAVYRVCVATSQRVAAQAPNLLSADELARAGRYLQAADQQRYLVARTVLRLVLGRYTQQAPAAVQFGETATHKPFVLNAPGVHFSLSHTRNWVLLALSATELGVDTEEINPSFGYTDVLTHNFSEAERIAITQSPDPRRQFYQSWTRKEALVKATGRGIDDDFAAVPSLDGTHRLPGRTWQVDSFVAAEQHLGALAYQAGPSTSRLAFYELTPERLLAQLSPA